MNTEIIEDDDVLDKIERLLINKNISLKLTDELRYRCFSIREKCLVTYENSKINVSEYNIEIKTKFIKK